MRILLINPVIRPEQKPMYFPLGLGYIASCLREDGHEVSAIDLSVTRLKNDEFASQVHEFSPDMVGLTGLITEYSQMISLCHNIRKASPGSMLVLGGGLATILPELMLTKTEADYAVLAEGEETVRLLAGLIQSSEELDSLPGIAVRRGGEASVHPPAEPLGDLDNIPHPAWDLFSAETYFNNMRECWLFDRSYKAASIITGRGCPYNCVYCDHGIWGRRHRRRSVSGVIRELTELKARYQIHAFLVADDTFTLKKDWVLSFCDALRESELNLKWACNSRVDRIDADIIRSLKKAGCVTVAYGIETASPVMLEELGKNTTVEQIRNALRLTIGAGLGIRVYLMMGCFGETRETIFETVNLLNEFKLSGSFNIVTPIPGTVLFEQAVARGKIKEPIESLLEKWCKWQDDVIVPLTDHLSPEQLFALKEEAELAIQARTAQTPFAKRVFRYWRREGLLATVKKIAEKLSGCQAHSHPTRS